MADKMEFPKTMREFIDNHSFKDIGEVYTNGAELVPVFRVEQALEHYEKEIRNKAIDDFSEKLKEMANSSSTNYIRLAEYSNNSTRICCYSINEIAEQLKVGDRENGK